MGFECGILLLELQGWDGEEGRKHLIPVQYFGELYDNGLTGHQDGKGRECKVINRKVISLVSGSLDEMDGIVETSEKLFV